MVRLSIKDPTREKQMFVSRAMTLFLVMLLLVGLLILRFVQLQIWEFETCLLYTSPSPRD